VEVLYIIKRDGNAIYTEILQEVNQKVDRLLDHAEINSLEAEIERIDRDWATKQADLGIEAGDGTTVTIKISRAYGHLILAGFCILWTIFGAVITSSAPELIRDCPKTPF